MPTKPTEPVEPLESVKPSKAVKVLAVSSGGGHWLQLCRLAPAWEDADLVTACVADGPPMPTPALRHHRLRDATRWDRWGLVVLGLQVGWMVLRERPDVVVTTGAAPGLLALAWGRACGAHTVWIDSLANVREMSGAGRLARHVAIDWLTQWPHLAAEPSLSSSLSSSTTATSTTTRTNSPHHARPAHRGSVW